MEIGSSVFLLPLMNDEVTEADILHLSDKAVIASLPRTIWPIFSIFSGAITNACSHIFQGTTSYLKLNLVLSILIPVAAN